MRSRIPQIAQAQTQADPIKWAEQAGRLAKLHGRMRVSPYYSEFVRRNGRKIDITDELTTAFYRGYDQADLAKGTSA